MCLIMQLAAAVQVTITTEGKKANNKAKEGKKYISKPFIWFSSAQQTDKSLQVGTSHSVLSV